MKNCIVFLLFISFNKAEINAQNSILNLEDIFLNYDYKENTIAGLNSMNSGLFYTTKNQNAVVKYSYETGDSVEEIFNISNTNGILNAFNNYAFNNSETALLLGTDYESRYRNAALYNNFVFDLKTKKLQQLSKKGKQLYATFAPLGNNVAYVIDNNLFYKNLDVGEEIAITNDGKNNSIINGGSDWVYEEEFTLVKAFEWSPDGNTIAYFRFDESAVPEFDMETYKGALYPQMYQYKYPKVGEVNSKVNLFFYNIKTGKTQQINIANSFEYIPRIKWTNDGKYLCIETLNRLQNKLMLLLANPNNGNSTILLEESSTTYLNITDNLTFLPDNKTFIWTSEKSGYNHIYLYDFSGKELAQITNGNFDVISYKGYDASTKLVYYISAETSPLERNLYSINIKGKNKKRITPKNGTNSVEFSNGYHYFINTFSTAATPPLISLYANNGNLIRDIETNENLKDKIANLTISAPSFFQITTSNNDVLNASIIKPFNFDPSKKYPVLMYVYGGPGSQTVFNGWSSKYYFWFQLLAQKGYIIVSVDNRGTGARGKDFRSIIYKQLGKYETIDQIEAAKYLSNCPYVDSARIGIFGWSYGGYMAALCITKGAEIFKAAISVAPVSNWKYYDNIYTERYMGTLQSNPTGFDDNAPTNFANMLRGNYLLIHGTGDDNVHFQNSIEWINALIANDKQFDLMIYPDRNHGISGGNTRYHLFNTMTNFVLEKL